MPRYITVTSVLNKTKKRDPWFLDDYTINPYSGCAYNCLYCYIRGSKYGINMAEKLSVKTGVTDILRRQLAARARKQQQGFVVLSSVTDAYQAIEAKELLTRQVLELLLEYRFPVHIITKSPLVLRDLDLLRQINEAAILPPDLTAYQHKVFITFSFTTTDTLIARQFEPGAPDPAARLQALQACAAAGFMTGVSGMPLLPFITDMPVQLEEMYQAFHEHGARYVFPASLTLWGEQPEDSKTLVLATVKKYYPQYHDAYTRLFSQNNQVPPAYAAALKAAAATVAARYDLPSCIPFGK
ncbi:SPL family radical SAM protein [Chitinophaga nivalis]|uniref:Radical SAM protein n=1 Tax=Chitinophaga nivalis TaxID=2991709 RepID=A0ABT3IRB2_9BACT|nr:radical SAM protein [Chitinophaga nivalis]MCW3463800.1 radical SAM protein [Chitinophaga nivalis]MCW3486510.1 radical SAM protein [Chitinophaga nivalis]